LDLANLSLYHS